MEDQIFIQHRFSYITENGTSFNDAIVLPQADYNALTPEEIEAIKQERFDNFKQNIENPPPPPVEEDPELILASLDDQIAVLAQQRDDVISTMVAEPESNTSIDAIVESLGSE